MKTCEDGYQEQFNKRSCSYLVWAPTVKQNCRMFCLPLASRLSHISIKKKKSPKTSQNCVVVYYKSSIPRQQMKSSTASLPSRKTWPEAVSKRTEKVCFGVPTDNLAQNCPVTSVDISVFFWVQKALSLQKSCFKQVVSSLFPKTTFWSLHKWIATRTCQTSSVHKKVYFWHPKDWSSLTSPSNIKMSAIARHPLQTHHQLFSRNSQQQGKEFHGKQRHGVVNVSEAALNEKLQAWQKWAAEKSHMRQNSDHTPCFCGTQNAKAKHKIKWTPGDSMSYGIVSSPHVDLASEASSASAASESSSESSALEALDSSCGFWGFNISIWRTWWCCFWSKINKVFPCCSTFCIPNANPPLLQLHPGKCTKLTSNAKKRITCFWLPLMIHKFAYSLKSTYRIRNHHKRFPTPPSPPGLAIESSGASALTAASSCQLLGTRPSIKMPEDLPGGQGTSSSLLAWPPPGKTKATTRVGLCLCPMVAIWG